VTQPTSPAPRLGGAHQRRGARPPVTSLTVDTLLFAHRLLLRLIFQSVAARNSSRAHQPRLPADSPMIGLGVIGVGIASRPVGDL
jgi:hypothetical protein